MLLYCYCYTFLHLYACRFHVLVVSVSLCCAAISYWSSNFQFFHILFVLYVRWNLNLVIQFPGSGDSDNSDDDKTVIKLSFKPPSPSPKTSPEKISPKKSSPK
eukprot:Pgem_evm1s12552